MPHENAIVRIKIDFIFNDAIHGRICNRNITVWYKHHSSNVLFVRDNNTFQWYKHDLRFHIDDRKNQVKCAIPEIEIEYQRLLKSFVSEPDVEHLISANELGLI